MELYQLRTFVVVAEERSVTRAAKRLCTTPPSVSAHIKALEQELGVTLFTRLSNGMRTTDKGEQLRRKAEATLKSVQDLFNCATELKAQLTGTLKLGLNYLPWFLRIPQLLNWIHEHCPGIEVHLIGSASGKLHKALQEKILDAGFVFAPVHRTDLIVRPLCMAKLVVAAPKQWEERISQADWTTIAKLPWISKHEGCAFGDISEKLFRQRNLQYQPTIVCGSEATITELISAGSGLSLMERTTAKLAVDDEKITIWETDPIHCQLSFCYLADRQNEPLISTINDGVLSVWEQVGSPHTRAC